MSLSPDGTLLAVIHFSGRLSLWDVPSLKQRATWGQDQQVRLEAACVYVLMLSVCIAGNTVYARCLTDCIKVISECVRVSH